MNISRRFFIQSSGALALYLGVSPVLHTAHGGMLLSKVTVTPSKTLVVIFLRGGADGLNIVVPYGEEEYYKLRPGIAIARPTDAKADQKALDLDGFFGLHPRLGGIKPLFDSGLAVAAHAVGYDRNTRSHFEEQDTWETGMVGNTVSSDGWLNRHLTTSEGHGPIRAVAIGDNLPRILHGKAPAFAVRGLDDLVIPGGKAGSERIAAALETAYCTPKPDRAAMKIGATDLLSSTARTTLDGVKQLQALTKEKYVPGSDYPKTDLAGRLMQVARLIKSNVGLEVAEVDFGGWDTHNNQGGAAGAQANLIGQLGDALAAFQKDLAEKMDDVVVVTITDFGRTCAENGTSGTDHGWANCMLLMGGPVAKANTAAASDGKARKVVANWPGLLPDQLHQKRDLLHTTDFRDVLGELVATHLGNSNITKVLPSHKFTPVGLVRA